jgi:hypothetical protein
VVLLADQPGVGPGSSGTVVAAVQGDVEAARARYADGAGHPVAFARRVWPRVAAVTGDRGARDLLADLASSRSRWAAPPPATSTVPTTCPGWWAPGGAVGTAGHGLGSRPPARSNAVQVEGLTHLRSGKVRDLYEVDDDHLLLVASDRVSTYDVVHPTPVPTRGGC